MNSEHDQVSLNRDASGVLHGASGPGCHSGAGSGDRRTTRKMATSSLMQGSYHTEKRLRKPFSTNNLHRRHRIALSDDWGAVDDRGPELRRAEATRPGTPPSLTVNSAHTGR